MTSGAMTSGAMTSGAMTIRANTLRLLFTALASLVAVGCGEATQVIVLIDAEPGIRQDADVLQVKVEGRSEQTGAGVTKLDEPLTLTADQRWPIRVALRPQGDNPNRVFALEVTARDGSADIGTARLVSSYVDGKTRYVLLLLEDACRGLRCDAEADQTCRAGQCVMAYVAPEALSSSKADALDTKYDAGTDGALPDADVDAAVADGGTDAAVDATVTDASDDAATDSGTDATVDAGCGMPEVCNDMDDDCDGTVDEQVTRGCGSSVGICTRGTQTCSAGAWGTCSGTPPATESNACDAIDSDCDGKTDESVGCVLHSRRDAIDISSNAINDIVTDESGNIFATGYTCTDFSSESCDLWVGRFDSTGVRSWLNRYDNGFTGYQYFLPDVGMGIALDPTGNVVALGHMCNSGTEQSCDLWLRKFTPTGGAVTGWNFNLDVNMTSTDLASDVVVAADGSVYVAATISANYDPSDVWIRKYNNAGAVVWTETFNSLGSYQDGVNALAVDSTGDLLVAGYTNDNQAWLRKYAPDRTVRWTRTHNYSDNMNPYATATDVAIDSNDNVFLIGRYSTAITWIRKYDPDGNLVDFVDIAFSTNANRGPAITVDADDNVIVALSPYVSSPNGRDLRIQKYNNELNSIWTRTYDNAGADEYAHTVTTNARREVIVGGGATADSNTSNLEAFLRIYGP